MTEEEYDTCKDMAEIMSRENGKTNMGDFNSKMKSLFALKNEIMRQGHMEQSIVKQINELLPDSISRKLAMDALNHINAYMVEQFENEYKIDYKFVKS